MLNFNPSWRYESPGAAPDRLVDAFASLIARLASQGGGKQTYEHFKARFAQACGEDYHSSSDLSWAISDLRREMDRAAENAPLFIAVFYDGCISLNLKVPGTALPSDTYLNRILAENKAGFQICPPDLVAGESFIPVPVVPPPPSLTEQARAIIQKSYDDSNQMLDERRWRPAVQEILWLLESVSTAFRALEIDETTITGKYFNTIVQDLKRAERHRTLDQVLGWVQTLHGYLSAPGGGAVRHGAYLRDDLEISASEARLYCNLTRSYVSFLTEEHERLSVGRLA
jgi:hypothetical protein